MTEYMILTVAIALLVFGLLMLFYPDALDRLERQLNKPVGERPVVTLRAGIPGEQNIEQILNRPVLKRAIYWDHWIRRQPRAVGVVLLAAAAACIAAVAG